MAYDTVLPFSFPAIRGKKLTAAFDGGRLSSDCGVMLLAQAAQRMGIAEKLVAVIPEPSSTHSLEIGALGSCRSTEERLGSFRKGASQLLLSQRISSTN